MPAENGKFEHGYLLEYEAEDLIELIETRKSQIDRIKNCSDDMKLHAILYLDLLKVKISCLTKTEGVQNDHQKRGVQGSGNRNDG
jgi:hypothetical protein